MYMYRSAIKQLERWQASENRKPLIVRGARQTGKTELLKNFGKTHYDSFVYVNFEDTPNIEKLFEMDLDPRRIIKIIEQITGNTIIPGKTLLILDEIQSVPRAITSLKYFYENTPEYHIAVAGSLLGIALHSGTSFPVGKVDFIDLHPMTFTEYLIASKRHHLADYINDPTLPAEINIFHQELISYLKEYFIIGGMPEAIKTYIETNSFAEVRQIQRNITDAYELDFSKHAPNAEYPKIREIYNTIPTCLAKEHKKFIFSAIRETARAREYETALLWIEDTGLASRVPRVNSIHLPMSSYVQTNSYKLFMSDIGLLSAKMNIAPEILLDENKFFTDYKGALAEQFVFQELKATKQNIYYYSREDSRGEIDFILDLRTNILPLEVKSGTNLQSISLNNFLKNHDLKKAVKLSLLPYQANEIIDNIPLYLAGIIPSHYKETN